jgi:phosphoglycolate phosphatase-like HAD superfamily hydrolase
MIKKFSILLITIFYANSCLAEIIKTNDFKVIKDQVQSAEGNTIVIFDIDNVLLQPKDYSLRNYHDSKEQNKAENFFKEIEKRLNHEQISEILMQTKVEPVDKRMIELINAIQKKGVKVLALTARVTGKFGKISSMENWSIKELKNLGYNFDKSWINLQDKIFDQFPSKDPKLFPKFKLPMFQQGVVSTCGVPKGRVLEAFLNYIKLHPAKILFVDDKRKNLESVAYFAREANINFFGVEYTFAQDSNIKSFNEERAKFQLDTLEKEHKWLSDQEADSLLHQKKLECIKILTKEVRIAQKQFPNGDYKDVNYVKNIIHQMYLLDQKIRTALINDFNSIEGINLITFMDRFHTKQMKKILQAHGWIIISKFGKESDQQAWLLVQHADHDPFFQAGCAFILKYLVKLGETNKRNYAYLYDRAVLNFQNLGMKQKYGTQITIFSDQITLLPYEGSIKELNKRRKAIGLDPVEKYLDTLKNAYRGKHN